MAFKIFAGVLAVALLGGYLIAPVLKLREVDLGIAVAIGLVMVLVDLVQSLRKED